MCGGKSARVVAGACTRRAWGVYAEVLVALCVSVACGVRVDGLGMRERQAEVSEGTDSCGVQVHGGRWLAWCGCGVARVAREHWSVSCSATVCGVAPW